MRFLSVLDVRNARVSFANLLSGIVPRPRARRRIKTPRPYRPRLEMLEDRNLLSTFTVNHLADDLVGSGLNGSLRYCITNAVDNDTITFGVTGTINLTGALPSPHSISIEGPGADQLTVRRDRGGIYRIFSVDRGATVSIAGLTIANGYVLADDGGGIWNAGVLTITNSRLSGNSVDPYYDEYGRYGGLGGGIYNSGTLTVTGSTLSGNSTVGPGGGIYGDGGGIYNYYGTLTVTGSTLSSNTASYGGGIYNYYGTLTVTGSTLSGNSLGRGGGIYNSGTLTVSNSTLSGNRAGSYGGGVFVAGGSPVLHNTLIAGNYRGATGTAGDDVYGGLNDSGDYNLIGDGTGMTGLSNGVNGNLVGTAAAPIDPLLGPLQDNGGPTFTHALLASSPALTAGNPNQLGVPDQRGVVRSGGVNIGAFQASASAFVLTAPATLTAGTAFNLTVKAVDSFGQTAIGYRGTAHFTGSDGQADLPGDYTFTSGDAGMHTFSSAVTLKTAGGQTITVTDTTTGSITGRATINVTPAAADHLLLTGPTSASAGTPFDLVVTVQDQYGNTVTGYTGTVTFATDDSDGIVPGDYTFTADDAGSHTFSGGATLYADGSRITVADTTVDTLTGSLVIRLA